MKPKRNQLKIKLPQTENVASLLVHLLSQLFEKFGGVTTRGWLKSFCLNPSWTIMEEQQTEKLLCNSLMFKTRGCLQAKKNKPNYNESFFIY